MVRMMNCSMMSRPISRAGPSRLFTILEITLPVVRRARRAARSSARFSTVVGCPVPDGWYRPPASFTSVLGSSSFAGVRARVSSTKPPSRVAAARPTVARSSRIDTAMRCRSSVFGSMTFWAAVSRMFIWSASCTASIGGPPGIVAFPSTIISRRNIDA